MPAQSLKMRIGGKARHTYLPEHIQRRDLSSKDMRFDGGTDVTVGRYIPDFVRKYEGLWEILSGQFVRMRGAGVGIAGSVGVVGERRLYRKYARLLVMRLEAEKQIKLMQQEKEKARDQGCKLWTQ